MSVEDWIEQGLCAGFDRHDQAEAEHDFEDLEDKGCFFAEVDKSALQRQCYQHTRTAAKQQIAALDTRLKVVQVDIGGPCVKLDKEHVAQRQCYQHAHYQIEDEGLFAGFLEYGVQTEHQHHRHAQRYKDVGGGVHTQIHTGQTHQQDECDTDDAHHKLFGEAGGTAQ